MANVVDSADRVVALVVSDVHVTSSGCSLLPFKRVTRVPMEMQVHVVVVGVVVVSMMVVVVLHGWIIFRCCSLLLRVMTA